MKNYKFIVPIVVVLSFVLSAYMLYDSKYDTLQQYNELLASARDHREQGILVDAQEDYLACVELKPSVELSREIGEFYWDAQWNQKAMDWGEEMLAQYPTDVKSFEFMMISYDQMEDYIECFKLADMAKKKNLSSPTIDEIMKKIEYYYFFNGEYDDAGSFSNDRCPVMIEDKWGYVTSKGKKATDFVYSYAGPFSKDMAPVVDLEGKAYFIDKDGNKKHVVLNVDNVEKVGYISGDIFPLYNGKNWGFYNLEHEHVFGAYEDVSSLGNGVAGVKEKGKWHLIDKNGQKLGNGTYDSVVQDEKNIVYRNDRLFVSDGKKMSMIDINGKEVASFEDARMFLDSTYSAVRVNGKWGFADKDGKLVIEAKYEDAHSFSNGFAAVCSGGKWGYINLEGRLVIAPQFSDARDFSPSGNAFVMTDGHWELLRLYKYNFNS